MNTRAAPDLMIISRRQVTVVIRQTICMHKACDYNVVRELFSQVRSGR